MTITTDLGTHEQEDDHVFNGVNYYIECLVTNTESYAERCDKGYDMPHTIEVYTEIELLQVFYGEDNEFILTDETILKELEQELYKY